MLLSITTTHRPATDLGYLLAKHPDRLQSFALGFGEAHIVYPEASESRCTAVLILDLDPVSLVRGRPAAGSDAEVGVGPLANYVNDRPYVASSFLSVAIAKVLGSALGGRRTTKPDLVTADLPLSATVGPIRVRGGVAVIERLFLPLGYQVTTEPGAGAGCDPRHWMLTLSATTRVQTLLSHLYVLIPVMDDGKHYWVSDDEIEKLLRHGEGWLAGHPEREFITWRYLWRGPTLARRALDRLAALDPEGEAETGSDPMAPDGEEPPTLNNLRHQIVLRAIEDSGATSVLDLGCGEGRLLRLLLADKRFEKVVGVDVSMSTLDSAREWLNLDRMPDRQRDRLSLLQSALTYRDRRLEGFDAAALVEVVEHVDPGRLPAFERTVFGHARPGTVVLTTPNRDWNATIPALADGRLRHHDHRFEWTRAEFAEWTAKVAADFSYEADLNGIGKPDPELGCPTQMAVFRCR